MQRATSAGLVVVGLTLGGAAYAEPARAPTLSVGAGVTSYQDDLSSDDEVAGAHLAATLAWDRAPPAYRADGGWDARGDLVPELTVARFSGRTMGLLGLRLELDYSKPDTRNWSRERSSVWLSPKLGVLSGADSAVVGVELGMSNQIGDSGWSYGLMWAALTWKDETVAAAAVTRGGSADVMQPVERDRQVALSLSLTLARAY